ncbi:M56 family metallopeptidase [Polaribacter porphyrae]|uniref:Peptidase M56 domain-containing protein n=1 Tax=Polaribacter porphyrae TaxID=1137780 RepID=A0A2S7WT23_9FLAO|nr:M56 family metallopeptidase [Polaribacter porphyrae]PQJ80750.1 hypothetical protein BTO18_16925 [Polaribacter porphyrae]
MIIYLLKSTACLAFLLAFYHFILEKEKMHIFNRFYLLGSLLFSFIAPLIIFKTIVPVEKLESVMYFTEPTNINHTQYTLVENSFDYTQLAIIAYSFIALIFLFRFTRNIYIIVDKIKRNKKISYKSAVLVLVEDKILPHTFWNYIFINKRDYETENIEQELFTHELSHASQKHTFDVLFIEFLQAVFWINPLFIFLKKAIQLNHEYLADETVINQHKNVFQYQHLLVNKAAWKNEYYLASNLNYLVTKKRLKMMTTKSSPTKILLKKLAVIPLLAGFIFLFAERVEAQEVIIEEKEEPIYEKGSNNQLDYSKDELYKEYVYNKGHFTFKDKNGKKVLKKYNELTDEEKKKLIPPPPLKSRKKVPNKKLIEDLKNSKKYALWIDGKVVKNRTLVNYSNSDFSDYYVSFTHKNARSKKFPQEYQANLSTHKYFKKQNKKRVDNFLKYLKEKHNIEEIKEQVKPKIIEIKEKKKYNTPSSNGSKQHITKKLSKVNFKNLNTKVNTGFKRINGTVFYFVTINDKTQYYNKEGKLSNKNGIQISTKKANASEIVPEIYVKKVYHKGSIFCEFIDDKPKSHIKNDDNVREMMKELGEQHGLKSYIDLNKEYENKRNKKPHFVKSSKKRQQELNEIFSKLGSMYFNLSKESKRKAKRPIHPFKPYVRLKKNGEIFYKLKEDLTEDDKMLLPPRPLMSNASDKEKKKFLKELEKWEVRTGKIPHGNNQTLKLIEKLAKKDAKFYFENKHISAFKALKLAENYKIRVESESTNNGNYIATLYKNNDKKLKQKKTAENEQEQQKRNQLDLIIDMAKNDALFYYEKQVISSDKAIELLKKNKNLNVHSEVTDFNSYKVWISKKRKSESKLKNKY